MIVLTLEPGEAERLAEGAPEPAAALRHADRPRALPAARVVGAGVPRRRRSAAQRARGRGAAPAPAPRAHHGRRAARRPGADRGRGARRRARPGASSTRGAPPARRSAALQADIGAARTPSPRARALDHKLGGPRGAAPLHRAELRDRARQRGDRPCPGFNPVEAYETAIANLAPELDAGKAASSVAELLAWAGEPLATAEVAAVRGVDATRARAALEQGRPPDRRRRRLLLDARLMAFDTELPQCIEQIVGAVPPTAGSDALLLVGQWLAEHNLGLVPVDDAASFSWPGLWLARVRVGDDRHAAVMFGSPVRAVVRPRPVRRARRRDRRRLGDRTP